MSQYSASSVFATSPVPTIASEAKLSEESKADIKASEAVTSQASSVDGVIREEKVEYRDQDGNLLDEEQVKALEGKVSFSTRYETKTRILDAKGNEIANGGGVIEGSSIAPPHPDVERVPGTKGSPPDSEGRGSPASVSPEGDLKKEKMLDDAETGKPPRPASEAKEATKQ